MQCSLWIIGALVLIAIDLSSIQVMAAPQINNEGEDGQCVSEILDIHKFVRILMSESNKQQQDLDTVKDDLGSLKFGFAILQESVSSESHQQKQQLKDIQETLESRSDELDMSIERLQSAKHPCKGMGWKKVVDLDMANLTHTCPSGWMETGFSKRTCGRTGTGTDQCYSTTLRIGQEYSQVCGRIKAYQFGGTEAFFNSLKATPITSIDEAYFDGVVLLYKKPSSGSEHIWTFAVGRSEHPDSVEGFRMRCPCDTSSTINVPTFVGTNYFCESQNAVFPDINSNTDGVIFYPEDVLWDGEDCLDTSNCCEINRPPYFIRNLGEKTYSDIEAKICLRRNNGRANVAVEVIELYVQ